MLGGHICFFGRASISSFQPFATVAIVIAWYLSLGTSEQSMSAPLLRLCILVHRGSERPSDKLYFELYVICCRVYSINQLL